MSNIFRRGLVTRGLVLVSALVVTAGLLTVPSAARTIATASTSPATAPAISTSHPYSDPLYLPLHTKFYLDCVRTNPGCKSGHPVWQMDLIPYGQYRNDGNKRSHAKVLAMGAGILHVGDAHGAACPATTTSLGTWVWIDHGGGYVSMYGHLSDILVKNGSSVTAGEAIGTVGTTGKGDSCGVNYTDVKVEHNGQSNANTVQIKSLRACVGSSTSPVAWPAAAHSKYATWNDTPRHTVFAQTSGSCLPPGAPATSHSPASTSFATSGSEKMTARWATPAASSKVSKVLVELAAYHPSTKSWDLSIHEKYVLVSPSSTRQRFTGLLRNHEYRTRVSFHNAAGWSRASAWINRKAT